ncbi:MAG: DUF1211 domain-containing protein [Deltaproteobacteria bacterium]|nr:DUF1211 domain-containing protein [Deltaproteobacteria bacterium]
MNKNRLEAFSDGVIAIIITIMVLEMKIPHGEDLNSLLPLIPTFTSYVLSFIYVGIYWNNHHHMLHAAQHVNGAVLWANLHLLFWLSLFPFVCGWMGENHLAKIPTAAYGIVLFMAGTAYYILSRLLITSHGSHSLIAKALGSNFKAKLSLVLYLISVPIAFIYPILSFLMYISVAMMWLVPDRRIEKQMNS